MSGQTSFGQRLRHVRLSAGLSQSGLEERSGIPKARLSRYENGHVLPSIETLGRLAAALQVSEASLLGDQREVLEGFYNVLFQRGVRLFSVDQAAQLANAVADILDALCAGTESPAASAAHQAVAHQAVATSSMASVGALLDAGAPAEPVPPA